jgi:hypothetical protein
MNHIKKFESAEENPEINKFKEYLKSEDGLKFLGEILRENMRFDINLSNEMSYGEPHPYVDVNVWFGDERIG